MSKIIASFKKIFSATKLQAKPQDSNLIAETESPNTTIKDVDAQELSKKQRLGEGIKVTRNWYEERADSLKVQRNILLVSCFILLTLSIVAVIVVAVIVNSRKFDPFVIQIDETTGMTTVVNPISSNILEGNDALARYFIKKYVTARETYNPVDFAVEARRTVRLLSTSDVYWNFIGYLRNKNVDPASIYGQKNTTFLLVKSWSKLDAKRYLIRFSINETAGDMKVFNKLAIIDYDYLPMELNEVERDINPVGFQIKGYKVDDDNS